MNDSRRRWLGLGALALCATLALSGCKNKEGDANGGTGGTGGTSASTTGDILVGEFASLTGGTATFGEETHRGIEMAIEEANAAGGINGRKLKLITEDDQSKPEIAQTVVTKLVQKDKVVTVLGEVASTRTMRAAPVAQEGKVPMITPSSTNPEVTKKGDYIFRVCFTDDFQAAVAAQFAWDQGYKKMAVFKDIKNDYSVAFADVFTKKFTALGGQVVKEQSYSEGDPDFRAQLNDIAKSAPDAMLVPGYYTEVGTIARQAREVGIKGPIIGGDGWDSPKLIPGAGGAGQALEGCFFTNHYFAPDLKEGEAAKFIEAFNKKYNVKPGALSALGYDAARIMIAAMKSAKAIDGPSIRDALTQIKDFPGTTGNISIDANRDARKEAVVLKIEGAGYKIFKTYKPEQVGQ